MNGRFSILADRVTVWIGQPLASMGVALLIGLTVLWGIVVHFDSLWGLVLGASTGLVSIQLLVLLQHSANRGNASLHLKCDSMVRMLSELLDRDTSVEEMVIGSEMLPETEIKRLKETRAP